MCSTRASLARAAGAGPGDGRLVVDADSFVGEVHGYAKQGVGFGYTHKRGYHPILATRADTGEVLHIRLRHGSANTSRGMLRFCDELIARVNRAGATGEKLLRADSGFWNKKTFARLDRVGWKFSIGVRMQPHVRAVIEEIPEEQWVTLEDYPDTSIAQIADTTLGDWRLVVRRVRRLSQQGELLPVWDHYPFATIAPTRWLWSKPSTASTPASSSAFAISKTRRWRTSPQASSTPTPPGR